jgi:hypothetical protein
MAHRNPRVDYLGSTWALISTLIAATFIIAIVFGAAGYLPRKVGLHGHLPQSPGPSLFFFALRDELRASDPITHIWQDGAGRAVTLT